ncbi:MAG: hypothetical protein IIC64_06315 [SAR324 cluster bacterium]|nr:hypothetical protein [SAR324 cluster bacterium]
MGFENRGEVIEWLNVHQGRDIVVQAQGSLLKVIGRSQGVDEIDACGVKIFECELATVLPGLRIAISLHDDTISIHALGSPPGDDRVVFSLPLSVPYDQVRLSSV